MANNNFTHLIDGNSDIKTTLSLLSFKEDGAHIIYSPALDLAGYVNSEEEAKDSFKVVLDEFIGHCSKNNTFLIELKRLGWHINKEKNQLNLKSPNWNELFQSNSELEDILENKQFHKYNQEISFEILRK
jgi:hypothetical protein